MVRMEIALFLVLGMVAFIYFTAEKKISKLHKTFSILLITVLIHLIFDGLTIYTVNHLDIIPRLLNDLLHRCFVGSMAFVLFLFYEYIAILVEEETAKPRKWDKIAKIFLTLSIVGAIILPIHYTQTPVGNYSDGSYAYVSYICVAFYLLLCAVLLFGNWKKIHPKKKFAIGLALIFEFTICVLQGLHHTWLISGMSMLYLKSQINPHFLYNTLDTIRIQAELNQDKQVAQLLMHLVDFFRISVKVDRQMVALDDELDLLEAYMDLMCYRYPKLHPKYDIDPDLYGMQVPNFILQPVVENSLLHGLKNKGYRGEVVISAKKHQKGMGITVKDNGSGFSSGKKEMIEEMLSNYAKKEQKLEGNSIGLLNVQKRIKLLCGKDYGLSYTENENGGVTAHLLLPLKEAEQ